MSEKQRSRRSVIDWIARGLLVLVILVGSVWLLAGWFARARLESARRTYESAGGVLELEEFLAPFDENGVNASEVLDLASGLASWSAKHADPPFDWRAVSIESLHDPAYRSEVNALLATPELRNALDLVDTLSGNEFARYYPSRGRTIDTVHTLYSDDRLGILYMARAIRARALIVASEGEIDAAYADIARILRIGTWMHEECPGILPWLLANAVVGTGLDGLEELTVATPVPSGNPRAAVERELDRIESFQWRGLRSELAVSRAISEARGEFDKRWSGFVYDLWNGPYVLHFAELIAYAEQPPATRGSWAPDGEDGTVATMWRRVVYGPLSEILIPNLLASIDKADVLTLRIQMARFALEATPDSATALPVDPFSGEALRWGGPEGCDAYAIGPNRIDDGGVRRKPGFAGADDVVWIFPCWVRDEYS